LSIQALIEAISFLNQAASSEKKSNEDADMETGDLLSDLISKILNNYDEQHIQKLILHPIGSHLVESIILRGGSSVWKRISQAIEKKGMLELSQHRTSNFVVQRLIENAPTHTSAKRIFQQLSDSVPNLLHGHFGVLVALAEMCVKYESLQADFVKRIVDIASKKVKKEAKESETDSDSNGSEKEKKKITQKTITPALVMSILYSHPSKRKKKDKVKKEGVAVLGSLLIQKIFLFHHTHSTPFVESLISFPGDKLYELSTDPIASHILEAFLDSIQVLSPSKHLLTSKLLPYFDKMSVDTYGSHSVEKCFSNATISDKELIADKLVGMLQRLSQDRHGVFVSKNLHLKQFSESKNSWRHSFTPKTQKRSQDTNSQKQKTRRKDEIDELWEKDNSSTLQHVTTKENESKIEVEGTPLEFVLDAIKKTKGTSQVNSKKEKEKEKEKEKGKIKKKRMIKTEDKDPKRKKINK